MPIFRQKVDMWLIYCMVMCRTEGHRQILKTLKLYISDMYADISYFYYLHIDCLRGLVVRGPGSISGSTRFSEK
jgi:hypothetical protein